LHALSASTAGKIELEYMGEDKREEDIIERLTNRAVLKVFDRYVKLDALKSAITYFANGWGVKVSDEMLASGYLEDVRNIPGLSEAVKVLDVEDRPAVVASAAEFILEGLYAHRRLSRSEEIGFTAGERKRETPEREEGRRPPRRQFN